MVSSLRQALLAQALLIFHVQSARMVLRVAEEVALAANTGARSLGLPELLAEQRGEVCGGRAIQSLLGADDSKGIRTTQWVKIDELAKDFIIRQDASLEKLTQEIGELQRKISEMEASEKIKPLSEVSIKQLIESAAGSAETFGNLASARKSECGYVSMRASRKFTPPVQRGAFENSVAKFKAAIEQRMASKDALTTSAVVFKVCKQEDVLKSSEEDDTMSYCDELCTEIASAAQIASDEAVGVTVGESSDELRQQLDAKKYLHDSTLEKRATCSEARALLSHFSQTVKPLEDDIKVAVGKVQRARAALDEAEEYMDQLDENLEEQEAAVSRAQEALQGTQSTVAGAKEKLAEATAAEFAVRGKLKMTTSRLAKAKASLRDAEDADHAAQQLKVYVSMVMLRMDNFFDFVVREPLRNLNLDEVDVDEHFQNPDGRDDAFARVGDSIQALNGFCKTTAMPAFERFEVVDTLSPLCTFGEEDDIVKGIRKAVEARTETVKEHISEPLGWLDRFHKQEGMTDEIADQYVAEGEPEGLRDVIGPFKLHGYFMDWRRGGPFLALLEQMHTFIVKVAKEGDELDKLLSDVSDQLEQVKAKRAIARQALQQAKNDDQVAAVAKAAAEKLLANIQEESDKQGNLLDDLEAALREAKRRWKEAQKALEVAFKTGTGLPGKAL